MYLDRYWREERQIAADLRAFAGEAEPRDGGTSVGAAVLEDVLADGLARLFGPGDDLQRQAADAAVRRRLAVVAGGPGTGKTTTVARIVALLAEQAEHAAPAAPPPLIALAAPTGKAAARLEEAVHDEARRLDVGEAVRAGLLALEASTLHRLLGCRRGSHSRFRHHRGNRLPHDVVVVDETSMVSLSLMARLVEAVRPEARLVLVGDPGQLTSIEAGAVLGDIVGPATGGGIVVARPRAPLRRRRSPRWPGRSATAMPNAPWRCSRGGVPRARRLARSRRGLRRGARARIRRRGGRRRRGGLRRRARRRRGGGAGRARGVPAAVRAPPRALRRRRVGAADRGLAGRRRRRLRRRRALVRGRPLLVTENDYGLRLYNGDTGVVVAGEDGRASAAFERRGEVMYVSPSRLEAVEGMHAMTIHKAQGSQFGTAAVLLPDPASRLLTRELLYTAITRARAELILAGTEDAVRAAIERPVARASGLRELLWGT